MMNDANAGGYAELWHANGKNMILNPSLATVLVELF